MKDSIQILFGRILRKYRLQQHLSQEKLAEFADLDRTYISQMERGLKSPSLPSLLALAHALHMHAHTLIAEVEDAMADTPIQEGKQPEG